ncbi:hypothetical protein ABZ208_13690 [Streptomyces sp. NPDC006208]|uniref:hypothetical protein n=1 Tax=Streptomyces sp. NPDC006208 TaxID=3156734 RepID=UPI0033AB327C
MAAICGPSAAPYAATATLAAAVDATSGAIAAATGMAAGASEMRVFFSSPKASPDFLVDVDTAAMRSEVVRANRLMDALLFVVAALIRRCSRVAESPALFKTRDSWSRP